MIEPIAYINVEERKLEWAKPVIWNTPTVWKLDKVPLYTHPVKQLSDEEIANIFAEHTRIGGTYEVKDIIFPFARAIIKASRGEE